MYSRANIALSGNWSKFLVDSMWIWFGFWHILKKSTMKTEKFTIYNSIFHKLMIRFSYVQLKGCRKLQKTYQHFLFWDVTADISEAVNRHHNLTMWIQFIETTKCDKVVGGIVSEKTPFQKEIIFFFMKIHVTSKSYFRLFSASPLHHSICLIMRNNIYLPLASLQLRFHFLFIAFIPRLLFGITLHRICHAHCNDFLLICSVSFFSIRFAFENANINYVDKKKMALWIECSV